MIRREIDLDGNATTRPSSRVVAAMRRALGEAYGNPSSPHRRGAAARGAVESAREQVAGLARVKSRDVVFTSGATEANAAILSHFERFSATLITTAAEHPSVTGVFDRAAAKRCVRISVTKDGLADLDALEHAVRGTAGPKLVAMQWANGETGVIQPVTAAAGIARRYGAVLLIDAAQAFGRIDLGLADTGAHFVTASAHKLHGPQGVGALFLLDPPEGFALQAGGGQERGLRGGTENLPGIVGFGEACAERGENLHAALVRLCELRDAFEHGVTAAIPSVRVNGRIAPRVPNTTSLTFPGVDGMALAARLEARGVLCSQVSACSSGSPEPSRTLTAMGVPFQEAFETLRFAFTIINSEADISEAVRAVIGEFELLFDVFGASA